MSELAAVPAAVAPDLETAGSSEMGVVIPISPVDHFVHTFLKSMVEDAREIGQALSPDGTSGEYYWHHAGHILLNRQADYLNVRLAQDHGVGVTHCRFLVADNSWQLVNGSPHEDANYVVLPAVGLRAVPEPASFGEDIHQWPQTTKHRFLREENYLLMVRKLIEPEKRLLIDQQRFVTGLYNIII